VTDIMSGKAFKVIKHPTYGPDWAPTDFFLSLKVKSALAGEMLTNSEPKMALSGVTEKLTGADNVTAFMKWIERFKKCSDVSGNFAEK
jgi:hypothetical protein